MVVICSLSNSVVKIKVALVIWVSFNIVVGGIGIVVIGDSFNIVVGGIGIVVIGDSF